MSDPIIHIVVSGDTAFDIANRYGTTVDALKRLNPKVKWDTLQLGAKIKVPAVKSKTIFTAFFDGKLFTLKSALSKADPKKPTSLDKIRKNYSFGANSGQPENTSIVKQLGLKKNTNYQLPKHQNVKWAGPTPAGEYALSLTSKMAFQKSGNGWGVGGWSLAPVKATTSFYDRDGFFLHDDGGDKGTLGCIGIIGAKNTYQIQTLLKAAYAAGQRVLTITIAYTPEH